MGEIGRDRREYLYEMSYCDILLIQRGYYRRNALQYQLQRLQAYGAFHCMNGTKKEPQDWLPMYTDRYIDDDNDHQDPLTPDEIAELQQDMAAWSQQQEQEKAGNQ